MVKDTQYIIKLNQFLQNFLWRAFRLALFNSHLSLFFLHTLLNQKKAARLRTYWEKEGCHVPPYLIASITKRCNLSCKGCYAQAKKQSEMAELSPEKWSNIFSEAEKLGISVIMLAGGEPWYRPEILALTSEHPTLLFPVFTNGLQFDLATVFMLKSHKNLIPIISLEGLAEETDQRRGAGVYEQIMQNIGHLRKNGIFFGISLMVTRENFETVTSEFFIKKLIRVGSHLFFFVEYTPISENSGHLTLTEDQRQILRSKLRIFERKLPALCVGFPGDEAEYDGCLAAGRGFVHVSVEGNVEPCPFAPYSDVNLNEMTLKEALSSELLKTIRSNHTNLTETQSGCALWENKEWVASLLPSNDLSPTSKEVSCSTETTPVFEVETRFYFKDEAELYQLLPFFQACLTQRNQWETIHYGFELFQNDEILRIGKSIQNDGTTYLLGWKGPDQGSFANIREELDEEITNGISGSEILSKIHGCTEAMSSGAVNDELIRLGYKNFMSFKGNNITGTYEPLGLSIKLMSCSTLKFPLLLEIEKTAIGLDEAFQREQELLEFAEKYQLLDRVVRDEPPQLLYAAIKPEEETIKVFED